MINELSEILSDEIVDISNIGGGSIADTKILKTQNGQLYFLKLYSGNRKIAKCEVNGLKEIEKSKTVKIPKIIAAGDEYILMEYVEPQRVTEEFFEKFGIMLAKLHRVKSEKFGFYEDNFIGLTPQINRPQINNWSEFYWEKRLLFQYKTAEKNGYGKGKLKELFPKLEKAIPKIIEGTEEEPSLLHGDLWSGNYLVNKDGDPLLIDPAVYYGNREAELAMTKMFGGFSEEFYFSYNNEFPLKPDWEYRIDFYKLYHVLNHLNLFGYTYYNEAVSIIKKYVGSEIV